MNLSTITSFLSSTAPAALPVVISSLLPFIVPLCFYLYHQLLTRLPQNQQGIVNQIVNTVVAGIEQQHQSGQINAADRKDAAMNLATVIAHQLGVSKYAPPELLSLMIEAAVGDLNSGKYPAHLPEPASVGFHPADAVTPPGDFYAKSK